MPIALGDLGECVLNAKYAVRGPLVARAQELERSGRKIIYCNIGNPQALDQKPLTFLRQVLALTAYPGLIETAPGLFPSDAIAAARRFLDGAKSGIGAYSESKGVRLVREAVAAFISRRDGIPADADSIYLTDGASTGVQTALRLLIAGPHDGIMTQTPQYPLYSASISLYDGVRVPYYPEESKGWSITRQMLEKACANARENQVRVKALSIINPGNPTGLVLRRGDIEMMLDFAKAHHIAILADEVYQDDIYGEDARFISFAKVLEETGNREVTLFSFHSCSKGLTGECGLRGGYMEIRNMPPDVDAELMKLRSISLCSNLPGQVATYVLVNPPQEGDPSYPLYKEERAVILDSLRSKARLLAEGLNAIPGISCVPISGSLYAFPTITLPEGRSDEDYCMALLEKTGICVVPGSGFGQSRGGVAHFRTTILPPKEELREVLRLLADFQAEYR